jgi:DNA-binding NarL/FixJ family response regulator
MALDGDIGVHWTIVSRFEREGREHLVIVRKDPHWVALDVLSERELQAVRRLGLGHTNKQIAFDMGLSWSTVRVLMFRAAVKLGVRGQRQLRAIAAKLH